VVTPLSAVEPLEPWHETTEFDCGKPELTLWLQRHALTNQQNHSARVYVVARASRVVAYYALAAASVERAAAPARVARGLANQPIPVMLLARMAVAVEEQGPGLGAALLKDVLLRTAAASEQFGVRALLVHAQDEDAAGFYERYDLERAPTDPLHLYLLMKDLRRVLDGRN